MTQELEKEHAELLAKLAGFLEDKSEDLRYSQYKRVAFADIARRLRDVLRPDEEPLDLKTIPGFSESEREQRDRTHVEIRHRWSKDD